MISYSRVGNKRHPRYVRTEKDSILSIDTTDEVICFIDKIMIDGRVFFMIMDDDSNLFEEAYQYLNYTIADSSFNTRQEKAYAFRLLFAFLKLEPGQELYRLNYNSFLLFCHFLKQTSYREKSYRDNKNVNLILSNISPLFEQKSSKLKWEALTDRKTVTDHTYYDGDPSSEFSVSRTKRVNYLRTSNKNKRYVPPYIRLEEFRLLMQLIRIEEDGAGEILLLLMYGHGLRIGECLGITINDVHEEETKNGSAYYIKIRNRPTDKAFQHAKNKTIVFDDKECHTKTYEEDTDLIPIDKNMYYLIMTYVDRVHTREMQTHPQKYKEGYATQIEESDFDDHYLFLNRRGGILQIKEWNTRLRSYFMRLGIPVDHDTKQGGLNHKFRHGFAMFALKYWEKPPTLLELKKLMRHSRLSSTIIYTRETIEDEINLKEQFIASLYNEIPELKHDFQE